MLSSLSNKFTLIMSQIILSGDDKPSLVDIYQIIVPQYAAQWRSLGVALGIEEYQLEMIAQDNADNPSRARTCCREMFSKWLATTRSSTWGKLDDAISLVKAGAVSTQEGGKMGHNFHMLHLIL